MKQYTISFKYSKDGNSWASTSKVIKAESDTGAIYQVESYAPYVKDIRILSVR